MEEICNYCLHFNMQLYLFERGEYEPDGSEFGYCMCDDRKVRKHYNDPCDCKFKSLKGK